MLLLLPSLVATEGAARCVAEGGGALPSLLLPVAAVTAADRARQGLLVHRRRWREKDDGAYRCYCSSWRLRAHAADAAVDHAAHAQRHRLRRASSSCERLLLFRRRHTAGGWRVELPARSARDVLLPPMGERLL